YWFDVNTIVYLSSGALGLGALMFMPAILWEGGGRPAPAVSRVSRSEASGEQAQGLALPVALVFVSGFLVMAVELCASRLVAGHIGNSVFTWTSVIGVILAGISLGNYLGGQLADSFESKPLVGSLFLLASFFCLLVLPT